MGMAEIIWLVLGVVIFALSFILPKKKEELDEDTKKFAGEQIRDILDKEVEEMRLKLDDVVSDTIEESSFQTERALEKLTNEKIMAINEYSDTVIEDINNNHKEVLFLYDMLNDKHVTIRNTVTEVEKTVNEVTQTARDIEISAKEAAKKAKESEETAGRAADITSRAEKTAQLTVQSMEEDVRSFVEDMIRGRVEETMEKTAVPMVQEKIDGILEGASLFMEQRPRIVVESGNAAQEDEEAREVREDIPQPKDDGQPGEPAARQPKGESKPEDGFIQGITDGVPKVVIEKESEDSIQYYVIEPGEEKIPRKEMAVEEIRKLERAMALEVMHKAMAEAGPEEEPEKEKEAGQARELVRRKELAQTEEREGRQGQKPEQVQENGQGTVQADKRESGQAASAQMDGSADESRPAEADEPGRGQWPVQTGGAEAVQRNGQEAASANGFGRMDRTAQAMKPNWEVVQAGGKMPEEGSGTKGKSRDRRNSNEKILEFHQKGMSDVAIARELGLGVGEVKLVIDLFKEA